MSETVEQSFTVEGMSCEHCVGAVQGEVGAIPGVRAVDVDLSSGRVVVSADEGLTTDTVRAAVEEAGYTLAA